MNKLRILDNGHKVYEALLVKNKKKVLLIHQIKIIIF